MGAGAGQRAPGVQAEHTLHCVRYCAWASLSKFSFILA